MTSNLDNTPDPKIEKSADLMKAFTSTPQQRNELQQLHVKLLELDQNVSLVKLKNKTEDSAINWLLVDEDVIRHLNGGELPKIGFIIYKNTRLLLEADVERVQKKDRENTMDLLFGKTGAQIITG